ncbi:MAG TPA: DUF883 family protein [Steroidobacteraceae bacterium]|jgi:ElaB/YqjD/DUF883 family membrane-anchored ribosome-binding protein|nr:DUF883 family protein [Steroidobacteraceae bacterium]
MDEQVTAEDLYEHLQAVIRDTEALLQATASYAGDKAEQARAKAGDSLRAAKERLSGMQDQVADRARDYLRQGNQYVRDNPWQSVGIAAGVGLLVGALLLGSLSSRRD